jgi:tRNA pseudouridine38/39 synthase
VLAYQSLRGSAPYNNNAQVVALNLRSSIPPSVPDEDLPSHPGDSISVMIEEKKKTKGENGSKEESIMVQKEITELDYCTMINRCLPEDIRVVGWCPVSSQFSARFSASFRKYRYFFIKKDLDIDAMKIAANYLIGSHDFRNICKLDIANVTNFVREIYYADIACFESCDHAPERAVWMLEIQGIAFLWHMVRCIMALLFLVGEKKEKPEIVADLLDIERNPAKPSYAMAEDYPLVLHECGFDHLYIHHTPRNLWNLAAHYERAYEKHSIAAARAKNALDLIMAREVRSCDLHMFEQELTEQQLKAAKKVSGRLNASVHTVVSPVAKRKFCEISISGESEGENFNYRSNILWREAISMIKTTTNLSPTLELSSIHVPLMKVS